VPTLFSFQVKWQ